MSENLVDLAQSANEAIADSAPSIDNSPSPTVTLLRGLYNSATEEWEKVAEVRELTGEDEEYLAALDAKDDLSYSEYLAHLLERSVVSIGSQKVALTPGAIDDLIIGDRDLLFLGTIRATYGRTREFVMTCGNCGGSNNVVIDLEDDFKVEDSEVDATKPIQVKLKSGETISLKFPTSGDSRYANKKAKTTAEQNTIIIARCLIGNMSNEERDIWAKKLNLSDRKKIVAALNQAQPGPRMEEVNTQCSHCEQDLTVVLDWVSLLFG